EQAERVLRPEVAPERRQAELPASCASEAVHHDTQRGVEIVLLTAAAPRREPSQSLRRVVGEVPLSCLQARAGVEEGVAVLGDEQEEQAIDEAQQLAVVVLGVEVARP